jgi:syntaxin-binding protein 5
MVTSLAVHPTGFFFAVGYTDGSIAFWAVDDDTKPLITRTLDDDDVDAVDEDFLRAHVNSAQKPSGRPRFARQPIFKLSWSGFPNSSDPRGGETVLTVLGGLVTSKRTTVTIFAFPPFNPPAAPVDNSLSQNQLHPEFRRAMYQSVIPKRSFSYEPRGPVQDYLLLPKDNPHFGGTFDPYSILLILDIESTRTVEAVEFPPPNFVCTSQEQGQPRAKSPDDNPEHSVATSHEPSTPFSGSPFEKTHQNPLHLATPFALSNAGSLVKFGRLFTLRHDLYDNFSLQNGLEDNVLELKGGLAYPDLAQLNELKLSKYQPRRILFTYNEDKTVRFFDLSTTLLIPPGDKPLEHAWPKPISSLTICLVDLLRDASFAERSSMDPNQVSIQFVRVASEALEVAVSLNSGEVLVYTTATRKSPDNSSSPKLVADRGIVLLDHIPCLRRNRLKPFFMLPAGQSSVQTFAISDIGNF